MRVSYTSIVVCGYSPLPRYALSCSCFRKQRYLFRSALFKNTWQGNSLLLYSCRHWWKPLHHSTPHVMFCTGSFFFWPVQGSAHFIWSDLEKNYSTRFLLASSWINTSVICVAWTFLSLLSIPSVVLFTVFSSHIQFTSSSSCLKFASPFKMDCTPLVHWPQIIAKHLLRLFLKAYFL